MSVAGERMMGDLGLTQVQLGAVLAAFAWGYAAAQFPSGVWGGRVGARRAMALAALSWAVLNLLVGLVPGRGGGIGRSRSWLLLIALRFLMGVAQAPLYPVTGGTMTCDWFPVTGWALPNSLGNAGLTLGAAATGPLIAWLMVAFGWRAVVRADRAARARARRGLVVVHARHAGAAPGRRRRRARPDRPRPAGRLPRTAAGGSRLAHPAGSPGPPADGSATSARTTSSTSSSTGCSSTWSRTAASRSSRAATTPRSRGSRARSARSSAASRATASR